MKKITHIKVISIISLLIVFCVIFLFAFSGDTDKLIKNTIIDRDEMVTDEPVKSAAPPVNDYIRKEGKLTPDDQSTGWFGSSIAVDGDTAIIGSPYEGESGAAYIFTRSGNTWIQQAKVQGDDVQPYQYFGTSVAIDNDIAAVGIGASNPGAVYIFTRSGNTWIQQAKVQPGYYDEQRFGFGSSIAIDGNTIAVGTLGGEIAHTFTYSGGTWMEEKVLIYDKESLFPYIPSSATIVALEDDTLVAATPGYRHDEGGGGAIFIFVRSNGAWVPQGKIQGSNKDPYGGFATAVDISGDVIVAGAPRESNTDGEPTGAAYIFTRSGNTWTQRAEVWAHDGQSDDGFGYSVNLSGDVVVIGAPQEDRAGAAYIFSSSKDTWVQQDKIISDKIKTDGRFGYSVAADNATVMVGVVSEKIGDADTGAVHIFSIDE